MTMSRALNDKTECMSAGRKAKQVVFHVTQSTYGLYLGLLKTSNLVMPNSNGAQKAMQN